MSEPAGAAPRALGTFLASVAVGVLLWLVSPVVTGAEEPWDSVWGYLMMGVAGVLFGWRGPDKPWRWPCGLYLGQFLFGAFQCFISLFFYSGGGVNLFIPVGALFLIPFCLPALIGSFAGAGMRKRFSP